MRSIWRTRADAVRSPRKAARPAWQRRALARVPDFPPGLARDIALVCAADGIVGVSFGAITVGLGLPLWLPMLLSVVVFAGASQFLFIGVVGAGGSPLAAVAAGLLVNARHVPFGFAVGDVLGTGWLRRVVGSHLMVDETVAFTLAQSDARRRRLAYWTCGVLLFAAWNLGVVAGAFGGRAIGDTDAFGLDAAFPAVLIALVLPSLGDAAARRAAAVGAAVALALTPWLPAGVPVLAALAGLAVAAPALLRDPPPTAAAEPAHSPGGAVTEPGDASGPESRVEPRGTSGAKSLLGPPHDPGAGPSPGPPRPDAGPDLSPAERPFPARESAGADSEQAVS